MRLILLCLFLTLCLAQSNTTNTTNTITVSAYSAFIASLPHTNFGFIDNGIVNLITSILPENSHIDVSTLVSSFSSTFYVFLFIIIFVLVILSMIVVSVLQCFCNTCGSAQVKYSTIQRGSTYITNSLLLFTVAIAACIAIYFVILSSNLAKSNIESVRTEFNGFHNSTASLESDLRQLQKLDVYNLSLPSAVNDLFNTTGDVREFFDSTIFDTAFKFNWVPVLALAVLVALTVGSCTSAYFNIRPVYLILGYVFFLCFLALSVSAIGSVSYGAFSSNFCASGIDTNMGIVINSLLPGNHTCLQQVVKKTLFCEDFVSTCDPFGELNLDIANGIQYVKDEMQKNSTNNTAVLQQALTLLESATGSIETLSNCSQTHAFYNSITTDICLNSVGSLVNLSTSLELIALLIFLFLLTALYTWHRITVDKDRPQVHDYDSIPTTRSRRTELSPLESPQRDCSPGCALHVFLIIVFWGAFTFGAFAVLSFGSQQTEVSRIAL